MSGVQVLSGVVQVLSGVYIIHIYTVMSGVQVLSGVYIYSSGVYIYSGVWGAGSLPVEFSHVGIDAMLV